MVKITLVAPYQELIQLADKTFKEHNEYTLSSSVDLLHNEYKFEGIVAMGDDAAQLELDSDVIISRGYTANVLKNRKEYIPVVEIPVAGNDLIRSIYQSKKIYGDERIAIIGPKNMIYGVEELSNIIGVDITPFMNEEKTKSEKSELVKKVKNDGYKVIIGGIRTCQIAKETGLDAIFVKTGRESLWQAITEAKRVAHISRKEQERAELFKKILNYSNEGVIAVDKNNKIFVFNSAGQRILNFQESEVVGNELGKVLPASKFIKLINQQNEYLDEIIEHNNIQLAVNKTNINVKGEDIGNLIIFQDVTGIQEREEKIRNKIHTRGHVAKHRFENIVGKSSAIENCIEFAKGISKVNSNILILGETGTGKEVFAQSIHNYSMRKKGPFVAVNCGALTESLLESELFGYVEGAFTGAAKGGKPGLFELAHRGTIFLDEIGEISKNLQSRLLREIQEKEIMRLGGDRIIPVDVRIISATNRDLRDLMIKGDFREDLYYRLDVLTIRLPSLRERREDIPALAESFIKKFSYSFGRNKLSITDRAKETLEKLELHGNVRVLKNICERIVVFSKSEVIDKKDVDKILNMKYYNNNKFENNKDYEDAINQNIKDEDIKCIVNKEHINKSNVEHALQKSRYNKKMAAEYLGISRSTLYRYMKELNIS